nr:defensin 1 [Dioryctria sylvestrella]
MAIKVCLLLSLAAIMFLSQNASGFPRDSGFVVIDDVRGTDDVPKLKSDEPQAASTAVPVQHGATHRVSCINESDEPTEDTACQEHCLPKGYSYGLCVSSTCTCV